MNLLTLVLRHFRDVVAIKKLPLEKLDRNDSKDELKQDVNDQDVEDILH